MKIFIIALIISILALTGCVNLDEFVPIEDYESTILELEEANNTIVIRDDSIADLEEEVDSLKEDLDLTEEELEDYKYLLNNLNQLLSNVYYGYASNSKWILDGFTAFSIEYNGKYYIITAGHCIENEYGKFYNFKFKSNFNDEWIYPRLLAYENDYYGNRDYAVLYSDKIDKGFKTGEYELPAFILGNGKLNIIKENTKKTIEGESGSPVININSEVIGIMTGSVTNIIYVLQAIDNLK